MGQDQRIDRSQHLDGFLRCCYRYGVRYEQSVAGRVLPRKLILLALSQVCQLFHPNRSDWHARGLLLAYPSDPGCIEFANVVDEEAGCITCIYNGRPVSKLRSKTSVDLYYNSSQFPPS